MSNIAYDFTSRTVLVTGAGRGIGRGLAAAFAAAGADVELVDVDRDVVDEAAASIGGSANVANIADSAQVDRLIEEVVERRGRVDVLVNNAGILRDGVLWKMDDAAWDSVLSVHLGGAFRLTRACVPHFRAQQFGRVINFTSFTGLHGNIGQANYAAAKAGVIGFTKTSAKELARFGVTVNAVSPNADTRMIASMPADRRAEAEATIPLGRFAAPEEMAAAVQFLASEEAGYITGVVLPVDGGIAM